MTKARTWMSMAALATIAVVAAACGGGGGDSNASDSKQAKQADNAPSTEPISNAVPEGATRLKLKVGPFDIKPGQNNIDYRGGIPQPEADGWVVGIKPDLVYEDGTVPPVDEIHLHHGVWLNMAAQDVTRPGLPERFFAVGEEKTRMVLPEGYGYPYKTSDRWMFNYMIHNLYPRPDKVWVTYDVDFIPADSAAAAQLKPARPIWMDVENGKVYPVFDVLRDAGAKGEYTYPDDATDPYGNQVPSNEWTVDRAGTLIATAGHLHPGGLHTDLYVQRDGATAPEGSAKAGAADTAHLFESTAHYYEPAGAVSWDVSMTATKPDWRVSVKQGDVLSTTATYDSGRASWYESMGIMVVWMVDATNGTDPFEKAVDEAGVLTHGHLPENDNHGGEAATADYVDTTGLPDALVASGTTLGIEDFAYERGDMSEATSVPTVKAGGTLTFDNIDAPLENGIWHTITSCKAPCDKSTGVAYPLADGDVTFDSGELGIAGPPTAGRLTWQTPNDLDPGTYTYFCRIHPFMRGAFRVAQNG